jgi:aminopeptidase N
MQKTLTHEAAKQRFSQFEPGPLQYTFHVKLNKGESYEGIGEAIFTLRNVDTNIFFDYTGKEVVSLTINGKKLEKVDHDGSFVQLPKEYLVVGSNTTVIHWRTKYDNDGNGCVSFVDVDGKQYIYTQFEPYYCNRVFPLFDQPDLKAKMVLNIIAPKEWKVLSNEKPSTKGDFSAEEYVNNTKSASPDIADFIKGSEGQQMVLHPETKILPNYLFCFVAGEYSELECPNPYKNIPMSLFCIESLVDHLKTLAPFIWEITTESMKFYESYFGYPFSFNKYEQVFVHEYKWGAMENAGIVTFNDLYVWKEKVSNERMLGLANTIAHELAHHWFGNLVTMKWWDDLWLNESFADFISHFCLEKIKPNITTLKYDSSMASFSNRKGWGYTEDQMVTTHPISGTVANTLVAESIFDGITYSKGAATMKQLMFVITEENFSKALSEYFHKFEWKNTILADFIDAMQHHFTNDQFKLEEWKHVWLEKACLNQIEPFWDHHCCQKDAKLLIQQSPVLPQHETLRMHKIKVGFFNDECAVDVVECWIEPKQETTITYDGTKNYKALLLNYDDQSFVKHVLDRQSVEFFSKNLNKVPDVMSRQLIWRTFYDMVKDSKITSQKYVEIFLNNIAQETFDSIFEKQFDLISMSISNFTPHKYREKLNDCVFYFTLWLLKTAPKENANRLVVLRNKLVEFASSQEAKKVLVDWYNESFQPLKEHKMTVGQQWSTIVKSFTLKDWTVEQKEELFAKQAAVDTSDTQKSKRATCDSLKASDEELPKIYEGFKDKDSKVSASLKKASMSGFNHWNHVDWLNGAYFKQYFEDLPVLATTLDGDAALLFVEYLAPVGDDLPRLIAAW